MPAHPCAATSAAAVHRFALSTEVAYRRKEKGLHRSSPSSHGLSAESMERGGTGRRSRNRKRNGAARTAAAIRPSGERTGGNSGSEQGDGPDSGGHRRRTDDDLAGIRVAYGAATPGGSRRKRD